MQISKDKVAAFHYTLTNDDGEVLDSSQGNAPLAYLHGADNIIPGLEQALEGKKAGDKMQIAIEPADAYGEYDDDMTQVVPVSVFQGVDSVEVGMHFQAQTEMGTQSVRIAKVEGDQVTVDGNHPLAGVRLNFDVEVAEVRDAQETELEHGHVHQGESCEH